MNSFSMHGEYTVEWKDITSLHGETLIVCKIKSGNKGEVDLFFHSLESALAFKHAMLSPIKEV